MADLTLWIFFVVFAVAGIGIFVYAFRSLGPFEDVEERVMELQERLDEE